MLVEAVLLPLSKVAETVAAPPDVAVKLVLAVNAEIAAEAGETLAPVGPVTTAN